MEKNNKTKNDFLGMPFGTATNKLRKMIMFDLIKKLNLDNCFQCNEKIISIRSLSIEHKKKWLNVDVNLFWELDNISFSHLSCNVKSRDIPNKINYPDGSAWCFICKNFKSLENFMESKLKHRNSPCTKCASKRQARRRERTGKR